MKQRHLNKYDKWQRNEDHILNDGTAGLYDLLTDHFAALYPRLQPGCPLYMAHAQRPQSMVALRAFVEAGLLFHQTLVWVKDSMVLGRSDYHYEHEPVTYGFKPSSEEFDLPDFDDQHGFVLYGWKQQARHKRPWFAGRKETSVFYVERPKASREHPTMKPVALIEQHLRVSSAPNGLVFDGFTGSGSTLLACERLGRRFRGIELDPRYCDVVVRRWEDLTGIKAERG